MDVARWQTLTKRGQLIIAAAQIPGLTCIGDNWLCAGLPIDAVGLYSGPIRNLVSVS